MLAKIGVNDAGLAVGFKVLSHTDDVSPGAEGVPIHPELRELLATCATIADVEEVLIGTQVTAS